VSGRLAASNQVAIAGYAHSAVKRHATQPLGALAVDTARQAIADAGLEPKQVDGIVTAALFPTAGSHAVIDGVSTVTAGWMAENLGASPRYVAGFQGIGQLTGAVGLAFNAVASGAADYLVMYRALHNPLGRYHGSSMRQAAGAQQWTAPQGYFGPLAMIALPYNEYLQRYGATCESMAATVVEARKNGSRIPWWYWSEQPLSIEEYLAAPMIAEPVCRYDCDIPVDGVAAFVFTSAERARDLPNKPVYVVGYASSGPPARRLPLHWPLDDIIGAGQAMASRLWQGAGTGPDEVDLPQGLRRVLAVHLVLAGGTRILPAGRGTPVHRRRRDRQRPPRRPARVVRRGRDRQRPHARRPPDARMLPAVVRAGRPASARGHEHRGRLPLVPALRGSRRLQRSALLTATKRIHP
jgi:hypothetical protein